MGQLKLLLKYDLPAGMRVSGSNICLISCILTCSKRARLYTSLISAPWRGRLAAEPRAGSRHGRCQALENMPGPLCSASFFWKWVCREELSPASDATHACQKCSTIHFLKFGTVTERLELTPECHLTLTSPVTVCWSKLQWCPSDKYKFWKLFSRPLNTFYLFGGDIQAHENMYVKEKENM